MHGISNAESSVQSWVEAYCRIISMTKRNFEQVDKKGRKTTWEWEETPEVTEAIQRLHDDIRRKAKYDVPKEESK